MKKTITLFQLLFATLFFSLTITTGANLNFGTFVIPESDAYIWINWQKSERISSSNLIMVGISFSRARFSITNGVPNRYISVIFPQSSLLYNTSNNEYILTVYLEGPSSLKLSSTGKRTFYLGGTLYITPKIIDGTYKSNPIIVTVVYQ